MHCGICEEKRERGEVSKCLFLSKRETVMVYFIANLGLLPRITKLMCELVVKLLILIGGRYCVYMFLSEAAFVDK